MTDKDSETEHLLKLIESHMLDARIAQDKSLTILIQIQEQQKKILFASNWAMYLLIGVLIAVSNGWFWQ